MNATNENRVAYFCGLARAEDGRYLKAVSLANGTNDPDKRAAFLRAAAQYAKQVEFLRGLAEKAMRGE